MSAEPPLLRSKSYRPRNRQTSTTLAFELAERPRRANPPPAAPAPTCEPPADPPAVQKARATPHLTFDGQRNRQARVQEASAIRTRVTRDALRPALTRVIDGVAYEVVWDGS